MSDRTNSEPLGDLPVDEYDRVIIPDKTVPSPFDPLVAFAQWRGHTCGPWHTAGAPQKAHDQFCRDGWVASGEWWFGCTICHPKLIEFIASEPDSDSYFTWKASANA